MSTIKITLKQHPEIARIVRAADPSYRKQAAYLRVTPSVTLSGTYWSGGSRSTYTAVDLQSGVSRGAPQYSPPQFGGPRADPRVDLPVNVAIVETGVFMGKTATATVFIHPDNAAALLPA